MKTRCLITLDRNALAHNVGFLKEHKEHIAGNTLLAPCIKANAYGHGIRQIGHALITDHSESLDYLCVQSPDEARILRDLGWEKPILNISVILPAEIALAVSLDIELYVFDEQTAILINEEAALQNTILPVHLMIDTGMNWQGVRWDHALSLVQKLKKLPNIYLKGLTTHFGNSDEPGNNERFFLQKERFKFIRNELKNRGFEFELYHCANSGAMINDPNIRLDLVQPGIMLYGLSPSPSLFQAHNELYDLKPVLTWSTTIASTLEAPAGEWVGYGQTCQLKRDTRIAVLPVGYYDGYPRSLGNQAQVLIGGQKCNMLGRVCMNLMMVDITDTNAAVGSEAVLIGKQGHQSIIADELAQRINTINYEITTRIAEHVLREIQNR